MVSFLWGIWLGIVGMGESSAVTPQWNDVGAAHDADIARDAYTARNAWIGRIAAARPAG
ncbi:hypothetical protein B0I08_10688 [Glaciihabitans tibetensis]|uniref:Uncharacterized protein n=1 Tax=Glaciihabitans tibetensis TaxID=1266600 RepID=A0A2T0VBE1_9MICO|nr:hypothetical protein B0I08_10688 [Glaciihabitans tibetensis]